MASFGSPPSVTGCVSWETGGVTAPLAQSMVTVIIVSATVCGVWYAVFIDCMFLFVVNKSSRTEAFDIPLKTYNHERSSVPAACCSNICYADSYFISCPTALYFLPSRSITSTPSCMYLRAELSVLKDWSALSDRSVGVSPLTTMRARGWTDCTTELPL